MSREIVLPELPSHWLPGWREEVQHFMRAAVEADRKGIVVTDEDVEAAVLAFTNTSDEDYADMRAALKSFAARTRGET